MSSGGPAVLTGGARRHRGVLQTVTLPSPNGGFPGALHDVSDDDVVALLTGRNGYHFGLPNAVTVDFPADHRPYPRLTDSSRALVVGDTYFTTAGTVITRSLGVPGYLPTLVADLLDKLGRLAASRAVSVIGVLPLAWKVPPPRSAPMPQPAHVRCTWSGVFGSPSSPLEIWSFSLKTAAPPAGLDGPALMVRAAALSKAYSDFLPDQMPPSVVLTQVLYAVTGPDGKILRFPDGAYQQGKLAAAVPGTFNGQGVLPLQTALVVSFNTARPGATGKGRLYMPYQMAQFIRGDFRIDANEAEVVAQRFASIVSAVNALGPAVSVVSSKGYATPITSVRVGRVPDTMRSRRNKLIEGYVGAPLP